MFYIKIFFFIGFCVFLAYLPENVRQAIIGGLALGILVHTDEMLAKNTTAVMTIEQIVRRIEEKNPN